MEGVRRRRGRDSWIGEREAGHRLQYERRVEDINLAVGEVGRVDKVTRAVVAVGEPGVDVTGLTGSDDARGRASRRGVRVPTYDVARDGGKEEVRSARRARASARQNEFGCDRVSDRPR